MSANLTDRQKNFARFLIERLKSGNLSESFHAIWGTGLSPVHRPIVVCGDGDWFVDTFGRGDYDALAAEEMLLMSHDGGHPFPKGVAGYAPTDQHYLCTITQKLLDAVRTNFADRNHEQLERVASPKVTSSQIMTLEVFISHSSKDVDVAEALIELIRSALNMPHERIRCTSVPGYGLAGGVTTDEQLKREIRESQFFIGIVTPDSLKSAYVLFELGARWGAQLPFVPLLSRGIQSGDLRAPLSGIHCFYSTSSANLHQLMLEIATAIDRTVQSPAAYEKHLQTLVTVSGKVGRGGTNSSGSTDHGSGSSPQQSATILHPTTQAGKDLLEFIQTESNHDARGLLEVFDTLTPGHITVFPNTTGMGNVASIKPRLFREGVNELIDKGWLYPPEDDGKTRTYEYRGPKITDTKSQ